jgi:multidrug efflux pump
MVSAIRAASSIDNEDYIVTMQRDKIANIKKTPREIANSIRYLLKGDKLNSRFKKDNKQYEINLQVFSEFKESPEDILKLFVSGGTPKEPILIPLSELISVNSRTSPPEIHRHNRTRASSMVAILKPGNTTSEAIKVIEEAAASILPEGVHMEFIGETQTYLTESNSMILVFALALCFIYLVMAAQFESWRDPLIIFFSVPLSLVGGAFALTQLDKGTLNLFSFIGFITLVGLITKHGILIVDFANRLREHGTLTVQEAIIKASSMRLRPILMTTFAMVLGAVPLMFGGVGNESRRQLGAVIIGGMSLGTLFTLFVVPTMYVLLTSKKRGLKNNPTIA